MNFSSKLTSVLFLQLILCILVTPKMCSLAKSGDLDEMPHVAAFHQGPHCLLKQNNLQTKKYNYFKNINL